MPKRVQRFNVLPAVSSVTSAELRRELRQVMLPAAANSDFHEFSRSLYRFGYGAGESFAAVQGGAYASEFIERLVQRIRRHGVEGAGQSSWGPVVFAVTRDRDEAQSLIENLQSDYSSPSTSASRSPTTRASHTAGGDCRFATTVSPSVIASHRWSRQFLPTVGCTQ